MLSGRPPFQADHPLAVLKMHAERPIPAISASELPRGLEGIVRRALAKKPEGRWPSATAMRAALLEIGSGRPPEAANGADALDRETGPVFRAPLPAAPNSPARGGSVADVSAIAPAGRARPRRTRLAWIAALIIIVVVAIWASAGKTSPRPRIRVLLRSSERIEARLVGPDAAAGTLVVEEAGGRLRTLRLDEVARYDYLDP